MSIVSEVLYEWKECLLSVKCGKDDNSESIGSEMFYT